MQLALQTLQLQYRIYNSDIEPEHETDYPCGCAIHRYKARKFQRQGIQDMWSEAVMYPGMCLQQGLPTTLTMSRRTRVPREFVHPGYLHEEPLYEQRGLALRV